MINARQYLISFLATMFGHKTVISGLRTMQSEQKRLARETEKGKKKGQSFNDMLDKAAKRALIVAPVWMLLRGIMMGFIRVITDIVKANLALEEGMARIRTVLHGTSTQIEAYMTAIKRQILDTAVNTRVNIKELAEAFYFLQTANLSAEEAMAGFVPTVNAMVGTGNNAKDTARAMAGAYNTMGKYLDESMTISEKFTEIADILTYTYATQDVQLSELIQSYTKLAPYLSGLSDEFGDIVTMLGFLNTRLLRGGRTGRLTGRAILQLTKNAEKLASILGITFDPGKQINFLDTIKQIHEAMGKTIEITAEQGQAIQDVFATRAGVVIRLLISHFDELQESIKLAREHAGGFAEAMAEIRMGTITAQMERMKNVFAVLNNEFISGVYGAGDFAEALDEINDGLNSMRGYASWAGNAIGFLAENLSISTLAWEQMIKHPLSWVDQAHKMQLYLVTWREYLKSQESSIEKAKEETKLREKLATEDKKFQELRIQGRKEEEQKIKHITNLLKTMGVHELDIARYKLESLDILGEFMTEQEYSLELAKRQDAVLEKQLKYREGIEKILKSTVIDLSKAMGASESEILDLKIKQLNIDRESMGQTQYLFQLEKLRVQQAIALEKEKQKELKTASNIYKEYAKAGNEERRKIERMMELVKKTPSELGRTVTDPLDFTIIDKYWSYFSQKQQEAMGEGLRREYDLDKFVAPEVREARLKLEEEYAKEYWKWIRAGADPEKKPIKALALQEIDDTSLQQISQNFTQNIPEEFWNNWLTKGQIAFEEFAREHELLKITSKEFVKPGYERYEERKKMKEEFKKFDIDINIDNITIEGKDTQDQAEDFISKVKELISEAEIKASKVKMGE